LSIPAESDPTPLRQIGWLARLSPVVVAVILAALWLTGTPRPQTDLRFAAPLVAHPGSSIGLRAWQIDRDEEGYTVLRAPSVVVELRNGDGLMMTSTELGPSHVQGVEGSLAIASTLRGKLSLVARATIEGREVVVQRALYVEEAIESRLPAGRSVNSFQTYEIGPLHRNPHADGPTVLDPRVEEGVCVPELTCTLSTWVGDWTGFVRVRSLAGVDGAEAPRAAEEGFVRVPLTVRGVEGRVAVEAVDEHGTVLASRTVRLPVVEGGLVARAALGDERLELDWEALGGPIPVLVDLFAGRRWVGAASLIPEDPFLARPAPGVWRAQLRKDLFSNDTAAVAFIAVGDRAGADALRAAAEAVIATADRDGLDPLAMVVLDGSFSGDPDDAMRALFAVPSFDVVSLGPGVSSTIGVDADLAEKQEARRWVAAAAILALGLLVSLALLRIEIVAHARGRRILEGLPSSEGFRPARGPTGRGLWAFVLLVFVMMAVLALSKRWF
jgi:hypothetical protein